MASTGFFFFFFIRMALVNICLPIIIIECHKIISVSTSNNNNGGGGGAVFVFGDSFFDPGNNNYIKTSSLDQANFSPYGRTHFHFPTGRFSDGRIIPDFILEYAKLPVISPYMAPNSQRFYKIGANFASAGAGALVETFQGSVISLETQIRYHKRVENRLRKRYGDREARNTLSKAVYLFSIGTNDYLNPYMITNSTRFNPSYSNSHLVHIVIANLTIAIKDLHKRGGRKFGFINLGPLGCLPGIRIIPNPTTDSGACIESASLLAKLHNQALANTLETLATQLQGFKYSLYDFHTNLEARLRHPFKYGYKQGKTACCGTGRFRGTFSCGGKRGVKEFKVCEKPQEYVFWDSYHLTETTYKQMAHQMWNQKPASPGTYNLKTLFQLP
ncbi:GDSL esterase/lipase 5-like [Rutidosis leptorrhynchoides]|uniref:GDSL esterase/lipase 5-like n=1 Tax=Rutidosis leptorrhynchoides TaxID=125765 RepID=UPI003A99A6B3